MGARGGTSVDALGCACAGTRDDNLVVSDVMTLSVQSEASFTCVGHRLIVKSHELVIRSLKRERANTAEANRHQIEIL
ncbi:unnamed protein product [Prunus armeniaca]